MGPWVPPPCPTYAECTIEQLTELLVVRRNGEAIPNQWRSKGQLIEQLRLLDDDLRFRFLDLPRELRNIIYRESLLDVDDTTSHVVSRGVPAILHLSKQIHEEVMQLIGLEEHLCIKITDHNPWAYNREMSGTVEFTYEFLKGGKKRSATTMYSGRGCKKKMPTLQKVTNITVSLVFEKDPYNLQLFPTKRSKHICCNTNNILYALCSSLSQNKNLRTLRIDVDNSSWRPKAESSPPIDQILWPLAKLPPGSSTTHIGGLSTAFTQYLLDQIQKCTYRADHRNVLRGQEADASALLKSMSKADYPDVDSDRRLLRGMLSTEFAPSYRLDYWNAIMDVAMGEVYQKNEPVFSAILKRVRVHLPEGEDLQNLLQRFGHMVAGDQNGDVTDPGEKQ